MFGALTVTVVHRGEGPRDIENNPTVVEVGTEVLTGCNLQQATSEEYLDARESSETQWTLFAPSPATPVGLIDRFRIDATAAKVAADPGQTYATFEQAGEPDVLSHIDGQTHHLELRLRRVRL